MKFEWPALLWLLLVVPMLLAGYFLLLRRKKRAVRFASIGLLKAALGPRQRWRRHLPPLLFLLALIVEIIAIARPSAVITLPSEQRTIILAIDVSLSMRASDIQPSRLAAAQAAAKAFVVEQPADVRIGIVSFAGTASVVQPPTQNRDELVAAIDRLELQRNTAIGSGIIVSLATLFPDEGIEVDALPGSYSFGAPIDAPSRTQQKPAAKPFTPVAPASYSSAAIILLTDGRRTMGADPLDAARMAADHGVRVFTVGFGTAEGASVGIEGYSIYMRFDEETLRAIADLTKAEYFHAGSADDLGKIYQRLNSKFVLEKKETEITGLANAVAAVLVLAAATLSLLWFAPAL